mmetsp:Transcript_64479/g.153950  ORF Transcript_64479/g.153950 Transcript_64479/m.153950 type:complete len:224 (-) Transcript_64479:321-992(-)
MEPCPLEPALVEEVGLDARRCVESFLRTIWPCCLELGPRLPTSVYLPSSFPCHTQPRLYFGPRHMHSKRCSLTSLHSRNPRESPSCNASQVLLHHLVSTTPASHSTRSPSNSDPSNPQGCCHIPHANGWSECESCQPLRELRRHLRDLPSVGSRPPGSCKMEARECHLELRYREEFGPSALADPWSCPACGMASELAMDSLRPFRHRRKNPGPCGVHLERLYH